MSAGALRERVAFDSIGKTDNAAGTVADAWAEQFIVWARIRFLKGGEPIIAQRLTGVRPVVITVRSSSATRAVDSSWRMRDANTGTTFNIRAVTPDEIGAYIDFFGDTGGAD